MNNFTFDKVVFILFVLFIFSFINLPYSVATKTEGLNFFPDCDDYYTLVPPALLMDQIKSNVWLSSESY